MSIMLQIICKKKKIFIHINTTIELTYSSLSFFGLSLHEPNKYSKNPTLYFFGDFSWKNPFWIKSVYGKLQLKYEQISTTFFQSCHKFRILLFKAEHDRGIKSNISFIDIYVIILKFGLVLMTAVVTWLTLNTTSSQSCGLRFH